MKRLFSCQFYLPILLVIPTSGYADYFLKNVSGGRVYENKKFDDEKHSYEANENTTTMGWKFFEPFYIGISYSIFDHTENSWQAVDPSARVQGYEYGIDLGLDIPLFGFTGYGFYRHTINSRIKIVDRFSLGTTEPMDIEASFSIQGFQSGFGMKFELLDFLDVVAEINYGVQLFRLKEFKANGTEPDIFPDEFSEEDFNSTAALLGISLKLPGSGGGFQGDFGGGGGSSNGPVELDI